jgi:hypothetical protein
MRATLVVVLLLGLALTPGTSSADVQVTQLTDPTVTSTTGQVTDAEGFTGPGLVENFCVVSNDGRSVQLTMTSGFGPAGDGTSWLARNGSGTSLRYRVSLALADNSSPQLVSRTGQNTYTVPAGRTVASSGLCGAGNVRRTVVQAETPAAGSGTYADTVTLVASPL